MARSLCFSKAEERLYRVRCFELRVTAGAKRDSNALSSHMKRSRNMQQKQLVSYDELRVIAKLSLLSFSTYE